MIARPPLIHPLMRLKFSTRRWLGTACSRQDHSQSKSVCTTVLAESCGCWLRLKLFIGWPLCPGGVLPIKLTTQCKTQFVRRAKSVQTAAGFRQRRSKPMTLAHSWHGLSPAMGAAAPNCPLSLEPPSSVANMPGDNPMCQCCVMGFLHRVSLWWG